MKTLSKEATVSKQKSTETTENVIVTDSQDKEQAAIDVTDSQDKEQVAIDVTDSQDKEQVAIDVTNSQDKEQVAANVTDYQKKEQVAADDCIPPLVKKRRTTHNQSVSDNFKYQMRSKL